MGIAFLLSATITQIWQFYVYYGLLTAIGFTGCGSMANSVLVSRWYVRKRAVMLARSSMGMNVGQLLLLPIARLLIASADFRIAFLVLRMIMILIVVPAVLFGTKNHPQSVGKGRMTMRLQPFQPQEAPRYPKPSDIWQLYVFAILYGISSMPIIPLKTGLIGDRFGANALGSILGTTWLMHQIFAAMGVFLGGYLRTVTGNYHLSFWTSAILLAMGAFLMMALNEQPMQRRSESRALP